MGSDLEVGDSSKTKMKVLAAVFMAGASAFMAPPMAPVSTTALKASPFADEVGAQAPLGFWDPLGFLKDADQERFNLLRYIELKHGRVAMLAMLGQIVTKAGIHFSGTIDAAGTLPFKDIPTGLKGLEAIPGTGLGQIILFCGFLEVCVMKEAIPGETPGDFLNGMKPGYWTALSPEAKRSKKSIELNNGRAAMMGILGLIVHEQLGVSIWPGGI